MYFSEIEVNTLQMLIQRLTFTPCIKLSDLTKAGIELDLGRDTFDHLLELKDSETYNGYLLSSELLKSRNRYRTILSHLTLDNTQNKSPQELFSFPKKYDEQLKKLQINTYNAMAKKIGFRPIRHTLPISMMKEICLIDGINPKDIDLNLVCQQYPYFWGGERDSVNFIEFILLLNIYCHTHGQTSTYLNKQNPSLAGMYRIKNWKKTITSNIKKPEIYKTYIDTLFEVCYDIIQYDHIGISIEYIKKLWLPEEESQKYNVEDYCDTNSTKSLRTQKRILQDDLFKALEKHKELQLEKIIQSNEYYQQSRAFELINTFDHFEYLLYQLLPTLWKTMDLRYNTKINNKRTMTFAYDDLSELDKQNVVTYKRIFEEYVSQSIRCAELILKNSII